MVPTLSSIIVFGLASNQLIKTIKIPQNFPDNLSLMDFLRDNEITIASSCSGVGTCQKCVVNKTQLSCQITLKKYSEINPIPPVEISYL